MYLCTASPMLAQRCGPWHAKHRAFRARTVLKQCTDTSTGCEFLTSQIRYTLAPNEPERRCGRRTEEDQPKTCRRNALCAHLPSQCPVLSMIRPMQVLREIPRAYWKRAQERLGQSSVTSTIKKALHGMWLTSTSLSSRKDLVTVNVST